MGVLSGGGGSFSAFFYFGRFAPCAALPPASLRSLGATPCGFLLRSLRSLRGSASRLAALVGSDALPCAALPAASLRSLGATPVEVVRFRPFFTSVASLPARLCLPPRCARWERRLAVFLLRSLRSLRGSASRLAALVGSDALRFFYFGRFAPCAALPPASLRSLGATLGGVERWRWFVFGLFYFGRFAPCAALPPASLRSLGATPCPARLCLLLRCARWERRLALRGSASRLAALVGSDALRLLCERDKDHSYAFCLAFRNASVAVGRLRLWGVGGDGRTSRPVVFRSGFDGRLR